jgi:mono/diheme cytochrome c family protein
MTTTTAAATTETDAMSDEKTMKEEAGAPLYGILAEYDTPTDLVRACKKVRDAGYTRWDTYTPFPIHGIEKAMGIPYTKLPWFVLAMAMTGLGTAIWLQWWTNAVDYPWLISGKPFFSWPANVPVMFELTILFSAFAALGGMLFLNNLPLPSHPLDLKERFRRVSDDKFFLVIEARDPKFDEADTRTLVEATAPVVLEDVEEDRTSSDKLPRGLVYGLVVLVALSLVPFAFFAKARGSKMTEGRIHLVWDMDFAPSYKAQTKNPLFDDQRSMRLPVAGTVARGQVQLDDHLHQGKLAGGEWATRLPKGVEPSEATMARGKEKFGVYCAPCHGLTGDGNGMVHQRAAALGGGWVPPSNLHQDYLRFMPAGQIYSTIKNGIRNMPGYGAQVEAADRWAIVLYVRALQKSRSASVSELDAAERAQLK